MRREDGVGPRVGALLAAGGAEQEGERQEPAGPHARGEKVKPVNADRERRGRLHRGGVARRRDRDEGSGAEQHRLAPRGAPVHAALDRETCHQEARE